MTNQDKPQSPAPVQHLVGRILHCYENTYNFAISSSFIEEDIEPGMCEMIIRVPSDSVREIINKCEVYEDPSISLIEIKTKPSETKS